jgi:hypothetical protein
MVACTRNRNGFHIGFLQSLICHPLLIPTTNVPYHHLPWPLYSPTPPFALSCGSHALPCCHLTSPILLFLVFCCVFLVVLLYFGVIFMFFFLFLWVLVFLCLCVFILFGRLFLLEIVPSIRRIILEIRQCLSFTSIHLLVISNFQPLSSGVQNWLRDISRFVPLTLLQLSFFTALTERIGYFFGSFLTI